MNGRMRFRILGALVAAVVTALVLWVYWQGESRDSAQTLDSGRRSAGARERTAGQVPAPTGPVAPGGGRSAGARELSVTADSLRTIYRNPESPEAAAARRRFLSGAGAYAGAFTQGRADRKSPFAGISPGAGETQPAADAHGKPGQYRPGDGSRKPGQYPAGPSAAAGGPSGRLLNRHMEQYRANRRQMPAI